MSEIQKLIESFGCLLYDTEIQKADRTIFRVLVSKSGGISLDELADISRALSPLLDVKPPMNCEYVLEVSSPGLERKLKTIEHLKSAIGEIVKIKVDGKGIKGELLSVDGLSFTLATKNGNESFTFSDALLAKTVFEWSE